MNFIVEYLNIFNKLVKVYITCESCHISNNNPDGCSYLHFKIGSDTVYCFRLSTVVACRLNHGLDSEIYGDDL